MNTIAMMKTILELAEDIKKLPPSKEREEIILKITTTVLPSLADIATAPKTNTGLPCPYCRQKLPRIHLHRTTDAVIKSFDILLALPEQSRAEIRLMCKFLREQTA